MLVYARILTVLVVSARRQAHVCLARLAALRQLVLAPNKCDSALAPDQNALYKCCHFLFRCLGRLHQRYINNTASNFNLS